MKSAIARLFTGILCSVVLVTSFGSRTATADGVATAPKKIRWVLAHEPIDLFKKAADHFAQEVNEKANGKLVVEVLTLSEYAAKYNNGVVPHPGQLVAMMEKGGVEMSQMYTTTLGALNRDLYALDLPYLFRDHAHATNVLEGKIGQTLLAGMTKNSNVRGLAFTYSGGYRVIPATVAIRKIEDFKGMKIRTSSSPVAQDTFIALGAKPVPMELEAVNAATKSGAIQGAESTYPRFYSMNQNKTSTVLNDTQHSLFLTSIVVGAGFWNGLDPELKALVASAANDAARLERAESIKDAVVTKQRCQTDGIEVVDLSKAEQAKFKTLASSVYKKYDSYFTKGLVSDIQNSK